MCSMHSNCLYESTTLPPWTIAPPPPDNSTTDVSQPDIWQGSTLPPPPPSLKKIILQTNSFHQCITLVYRPGHSTAHPLRAPSEPKFSDIENCFCSENQMPPKFLGGMEAHRSTFKQKTSFYPQKIFIIKIHGSSH